MGDPACYLHLLDEDGRMPEPAVALPEAGDAGPEAMPREAPDGPPPPDGRRAADGRPPADGVTAGATE